MNPELFRVAIIDLESGDLNLDLSIYHWLKVPGNICILEEVFAPFLDHLQEALP